MFYFLERSVAVIKPKEPFLDWVNNSFDNLETELTLESIRIDCNSYLIPEVAEIEDGVNFIDEKFVELFELELSAWSEEKNTWPTNRTLKMFWEWFDVEIHPVTIDISEPEEERDVDAESDSTIH